MAPVEHADAYVSCLPDQLDQLPGRVQGEEDGRRLEGEREPGGCDRMGPGTVAGHGQGDPAREAACGHPEGIGVDHRELTARHLRSIGAETAGLTASQVVGAGAARGALPVRSSSRASCIMLSMNTRRCSEWTPWARMAARWTGAP